MARDQDAARTQRLYDRRTVERNIKKGLVTRKDYEKHLKALDDVADKGVYGAEPEEADDDDAPEADTDQPEPGANSQGH
jgi:hypothetical protein